MGKERLDNLLVARGLAPSRGRAQALILAGKVLVRGEVASKAGAQVPDDVEVTRVDTLSAEKQSDTEKVIQRALVQPTPVYRVRIVRKGHPYAIRYDFFVYQHGFWKTGRELGKFLEPPPPLNSPELPVKIAPPPAQRDGGTPIVN